MGRRVAVLLNRAAGSARRGDAGDRVTRALESAGATATLVEVPGERLRAAARELAVAGDVDVVAAAGGDGTVSAVAGAVAGGEVPLGVLPLGTLNHFARDLGVPLDLDEAARVLAGADVRAVDVGSVNGLTFVNNVTVGLYADGVRVRERWRRFVGKWPAGAVAWLVMLKRYPSMRVEVELDRRRVGTRTPLVVVSNNAYALVAGDPVRRDRLDAGLLGVHVVAADGRWRFLGRTLKSFFVTLRGAEGLDVHTSSRAVLRLRRRRVKAVVDGEVVPFETPLRLDAVPGALRVVAPLGRAT